MELKIELPKVLHKIIKAIKEEDGQPYLVGGAVVDCLQGKPSGDYDIEVFSLSYDSLLKCLTGFGKPDLIGNKFGIVKLKIEDLDLEFSIPRKDSKVGLKHKDFDVKLMPKLSLYEAAKRRDFTINTIYYDLSTDIVIDPFDGLEDLRLGKIHYVDENTFGEDPLRAFRAVQLVARKGRIWTIELYRVIQDMIHELKELPGEAILGEMNKLLMLSDQPSIGLNCMRPKNYKGIIDLFPDLKALIGSKQNPAWHPEGDVWVHTMMVVDAAAEVRHNLPKDWQLPFMWGALLHDIGKPDTLDEDLHNYGHDAVGAQLAEKFMEQLKASKELIERTAIIVKTHMRAPTLTSQKSSMKAWRKLQNICPLNVCAYMALCDARGCGADDKKTKGDSSFNRTMEVFKQLGEPSGKIEGILKGRHLIEQGLQPGPKFGPILERAYNYQMKTGCTDIDKLLKTAGVPQKYST